VSRSHLTVAKIEVKSGAKGDLMRTILFVSLVGLSLAALPACSSDSSSSGSGGTSGTGGSGTGGSGTGGSGTGGSGTGGAAGSSSGGSAGAATGACTNSADDAIVNDTSKDVDGTTSTCGQSNIGNHAATKDCIIQGTGLSDGCAECYANVVDCVVANCITECLADPNGQPCSDCRKTNCDPAFETCSGIPSSN
jgi:hypothetical protein